MSAHRQSTPDTTQAAPPPLGPMDAVLDRVGNLAISLYLAQQREAATAVELAQARAEIEVLKQVNESLSAQLSQCIKEDR